MSFQRMPENIHNAPGGDASRRRPHARFSWIAAVCIVSSLLGCNNQPNQPSDRPPDNVTSKPSAASVESVLERSRTVNRIDKGTLKMKVKIQDSDGSSKEVQLTMHRKSAPDGGETMLIEFTSPLEERDRSSLIIINSRGEIEATRYMQSSSNFVSARGATNEDSFFGMTLQELADGQPDKYAFTLVGEERFKSYDVYRLEGKLKGGEESKFPRLVLFISKEDFANVGAEFYDNQNVLARKVEVQTLEKINDRVIRKAFTIDNIARGKRLDFYLLNANLDGKVNDSVFSREYLKKITEK